MIANFLMSFLGALYRAWEIDGSNSDVFGPREL